MFLAGRCICFIFLRHFGCLFLSRSPYRSAAALPWVYRAVPSRELPRLRSLRRGGALREGERSAGPRGAQPLEEGPGLAGEQSSKWAGKSKRANTLFQRTAAHDGDSTAFVAADVRPPARSCEDKQKPRSHFSSGWVLLPCAISRDFIKKSLSALQRRLRSTQPVSGSLQHQT